MSSGLQKIYRRISERDYTLETYQKFTVTMDGYADEIAAVIKTADAYVSDSSEGNFEGLRLSVASLRKAVT